MFSARHCTPLHRPNQLSTSHIPPRSRTHRTLPTYIHIHLRTITYRHPSVSLSLSISTSLYLYVTLCVCIYIYIYIHTHPISLSLYIYSTYVCRYNMVCYTHMRTYTFPYLPRRTPISIIPPTHLTC